MEKCTKNKNWAPDENELLIEIISKVSKSVPSMINKKLLGIKQPDNSSNNPRKNTSGQPNIAEKDGSTISIHQKRGKNR